MRMNLPVTGRDVSISDTANILSTTDLNGDITYVNPDFIKISGFEESELIGQHHNIVRHPDMPTEAFGDLWGCVRAGTSWMGMVKNRCKNGDHYWVSAFVTPISRNGRVVEYQSVRTKPQQKQIDAAEKLYAQLRDRRPPAALRRAPLSVRSRVALFAALGAAPCVVAGALLGGAGLVVALATAAAAAISASSLAYMTLAPLQRLAEQARQLGDNPVGQLIYAGRRDEFGQIAFAMKMLETEAGAMVGRIGDASRQLSQHAHELLGAMDSSSQSAARQQSETDQVATAINQMAASVQEVANNAQRTAEAASRANSEAATGTEVVNRTGAAIGQLAQDIQRAGDVIHELEAHSNDITKVLDVIRGIAEQTNLLALNAAIEAARAGEQGRGFAVVADEVRSLSQRTQSSTAQIAGTVDSLRATVNEAVSLMEAACGQAQTDAEAVTGLGERLGEIASAVQSVTDTLAQIATAVEEQASTADEVSSSIQQVDQAAVRLLKGARAVNLAADTLSQGSHALSANTARFQLR